MLCKYVDQEGFTVMLIFIQSTGVTPEVHLRTIQARKHASKRSTLALKPRAGITRNPKKGYQWPHEKDLCPHCYFLSRKSVVVPMPRSSKEKTKNLFSIFSISLSQVYDSRLLAWVCEQYGQSSMLRHWKPVLQRNHVKDFLFSTK